MRAESSEPAGGTLKEVRKTIANSFLVKPLETSISFVAEKLLHHEKIPHRSQRQQLVSVWCVVEKSNE